MKAKHKCITVRFLNCADEMRVLDSLLYIVGFRCIAEDENEAVYFCPDPHACLGCGDVTMLESGPDGLYCTECGYGL